MRKATLLLFIIGLAVSCLAQTDHLKAEGTDAKIIAIVLGKQITAKEKGMLNGIILRALLDQYAEENQIKPTDEELDLFVKKLAERQKEDQIEMEKDRLKLIEELKESSLSDRERQQKESRLKSYERLLKNAQPAVKETNREMAEKVAAMERQIAQQFVQAWKINKALYKKYGGRIIFQQAGPEPLDAHRDFLKEQEKKGSFEILDKQYEAGFWRYFRNDDLHKFYPRDEGEKFINTPWWMMEEPLKKLE